jgi:hypothetical protein
VFLQRISYVKTRVLLVEPATPVSITNNVSVMIDIGVAMDSPCGIRHVPSYIHLAVIKVLLDEPCQTHTKTLPLKILGNLYIFLSWGFI